MAKTFPTADTALLAWSLGFSTKLLESPNLFGISEAQAEAYATVHENFASAMAAVVPALRSKTATAEKNSARAALKLAAKQMIDRVNGSPTVTVAQKLSLGISVRVKPTPAPLPVTAPGVNVISVTAWTVNLKLYDTASSGNRGKPTLMSGAVLYSYVGETPPVNIGEWKTEGMSGRTFQSVTFDGSNPPGTKVWFSALWFNARLKIGPSSPPISTHLQGGSVSMAA